MKIVTVTLNPALDAATGTGKVVPGPKLRCSMPRFDAGGGGVNVARAIRKLGGDSLAAIATGGATGLQVEESLAAEGVATRRFGPGHPTRMNLAVSDETPAQYRFTLPGQAWSDGDATAAAAELRGVIPADALTVASGSLPDGVAPGFFLDLAQERRVLLDTSGAALRAAVASRDALFVLRMDRAEGEDVAGHTLPTPADVAAFATRLRAEGVAELVCIACGADGNVVAHAGGVALCTAPKRPVVSTVGAGDSFVGGFSLALSRGADPVEACARGSAAAASAVTTPATDLVDAGLAEELYDGMTISQV